MRYVNARLAKQEDELAYRFYLTDALKCIAENTAITVNGGKYLTARYCDLVRKITEPTETRTGEEIKDHIKNKLRGLSNG